MDSLFTAQPEVEEELGWAYERIKALEGFTTHQYSGGVFLVRSLEALPGGKAMAAELLAGLQARHFSLQNVFSKKFAIFFLPNLGGLLLGSIQVDFCE